MPVVPQDLLQRITAKAIAARDKAAEIADLEERLTRARSDLTSITQRDLPDLLDTAGVDEIGLPASGNLPAMDITLQSRYSANIAASWSEERRAEAFAWLEDHGHGSLIKTQVTISWPRELRDKALEFMDMVRRRYNSGGITQEIKENVMYQTLTAWFKQQTRNGGELPPLDVIGASAWREAKMQEREPE